MSGERTATACREPSIPTFLRERSADQSSRVAASASSASWFTTWKNFGVCPTNNPSLVNDAMVATAPPNLSLLVTVVSPGGQRERLLVKGTERHANSTLRQFRCQRGTGARSPAESCSQPLRLIRRMYDKSKGVNSGSAAAG